MITEEQFNRDYRERTIIGLTEDIVIEGTNGKTMSVRARIDTGATMSSIDEDIAKELELGPVVKTKLVKQAQGHTVRPVIKARFRLAGESHEENFTIASRKHMKYRVLIGQNALNNNYLIDPDKK